MNLIKLPFFLLFFTLCSALDAQMYNVEHSYQFPGMISNQEGYSTFKPTFIMRNGLLNVAIDRHFSSQVVPNIWNYALDSQLDSVHAEAIPSQLSSTNAYEFAIRPDGKYITSRSRGSSDDGPYIICNNPDGSFLWGEELNWISTPYTSSKVVDVCFNQTNNMYGLCRDLTSSGGLQLPSNSVTPANSKYRIVRISPGGTELPTVPINDSLVVLKMVMMNNYLYLLEYNQSKDYFIAKYDTLGNMQSQVMVFDNGTQNINIYSMSPSFITNDGQGNALLLGRSFIPNVSTEDSYIVLNFSWQGQSMNWSKVSVAPEGYRYYNYMDIAKNNDNNRVYLSLTVMPDGQSLGELAAFVCLDATTGNDIVTHVADTTALYSKLSFDEDNNLVAYYLGLSVPHYAYMNVFNKNLGQIAYQMEDLSGLAHPAFATRKLFNDNVLGRLYLYGENEIDFTGTSRFISQLTVRPCSSVIDTAVFAAPGYALATTTDDSTYFQWFECGTNKPATNQFYSLCRPDTAGYYYCVISSMSCSDTSRCVFVDPSYYYIKGTVATSDSLPLSNSTVSAYSYLSNTLIGTTTTDAQGRYSIVYQPDSVPDQTYIYAEPDTLLFPAEMPTYYLSSLVVQDADTAIVDSLFNTFNFYTILMDTTGGNGGIGGGIDGEDTLFVKSNGLNNPVIGLKVILINSQNDMPVGYAVTNNDGYFLIGNLPAATYDVWVDKAGINNAIAPAITIATNEVKDSLLFFLHPDYLELLDETGIGETTTIGAIELRPNPATETAYLLVNADKTTSSTISIYNAVGMLVFSKTSVGIQKGENIITLDVSNLSAGIYPVVIQSRNNIKTLKLVIK